jgi:SSS family solute:Na+ symporter
MLGVLIQLFTGWSIEISCIAGALLSLIYLFTGGFKADVLTNSMQFVLMYLGFGVMMYFLLTALGSPSEMLARLPESHKTLMGNYSWQYILAWFVISMQTFVDPSFHQRCAAVRTPEIARRGVLISILCWVVFDLMTLSAGLYARAYFEIDNPLMAFPVLADSILPVAAKGLFVTALLAVVMSTLSSYSFISGATIGNDLLGEKFTKRFGNVFLLRMGLLISSVVAIILAVAIPSAVELIYKTSSIAVPGLLVPLVLTYMKKYRLKKRSASVIMICASGASLAWTVLRSVADGYSFPLSGFVAEFEPMAPGIIISIILGLIFVEKSDTEIITNIE